MCLNLVLQWSWSISDEFFSEAESGAEDHYDHSKFLFLEVQLLLVNELVLVAMKLAPCARVRHCVDLQGHMYLKLFPFGL